MTARQEISALLINDSFFVPNPDVRFVILISAVEALCDQKVLPNSCQKLIDALSHQLAMMRAADDDKHVVQKALDNIRRQGVRSAYMTKIRTLLSSQDAKRFDILYGKRGNFVHDGLLRGQLNEVASEALDLAIKLLAADVKRAPQVS